MYIFSNKENWLEIIGQAASHMVRESSSVPAGRPLPLSGDSLLCATANFEGGILMDPTQAPGGRAGTKAAPGRG